MEILKRVFDGEIKGIDEKEFTLTAYVSTKGRDRMDEVLLPEGVDLKNYNKNPVVLWAHDYHMPPIGKAVWTKKDGEGILSKVKFAPTPFAQEIFQLYKEGFLKAFSVGFVPKEWEDGDGKKSASRTYTKWEMLEYSAVPVPANPEALTLAVSKGMMSVETKKFFGIEDEESAPEVKEETPEPSKALDELLAEIKLHEDLSVKKDERIAALETEVKELKYKLYSITEAKPNAEPEITTDSVAKEINAAICGVIRKAQGKVS